jgi:2-keto-4-pentenoate hydratase/2-oxohepta-3-ene-1,7-dioic acid hydratase in catechol pathway
MRLASYVQDGRSTVGVVTAAGRVVSVSSIDPDLPSSMRDLLETPDGLARLADRPPADDAGVPIDTVRFDPVVPDPRAIWCAALTFESHVSEAPGRTAPPYPLFFPRVAASQVGHARPLIRPAVSELLDYEGELAVVIGRRARHVAVRDALDHVAGYACYNEASVRDWQRHATQIAPGKNFAGTGAFGPWLVTADEFGDPYAHRITTRVNGEVRQDESIDALLFRIEYLIHYLSTIHPLLPGDVIVTGTPGGVGVRRDPPAFLADGDLVTVEIDGIGVLENRVADEVPEAAPEWRDAQTQEVAS